MFIADDLQNVRRMAAAGTPDAPVEHGHQRVNACGDQQPLQDPELEITLTPRIFGEYDAIKRDYPILYDLEKDWFETLAKLKPRRESDPISVDLGGIDWGSVSPALIFLIIFALRILLAALR